MTETDKKKIEGIDEAYECLLYIYNLTKDDYALIQVSDLLQKFPIREANLKNLVKGKILSQQQASITKHGKIETYRYKWNTSVPDYRLAYNYYNFVRNKTYRYSDLEEIVITPNAYPINKFNFALAIIGKYERISGISSDIKVIKGTLPEKEEQDDKEKVFNAISGTHDLKELTAAINQLKNPLNVTIEQQHEIVNIMTLLLNSIRENNSLTEETHKGMKNMQNSLGAAIAIGRANQKNLAVILPTQLLLLKDKYKEVNAELSEMSPDDEEYSELLQERENIGLGLNKIREQMNENDINLRRYG